MLKMLCYIYNWNLHINKRYKDVNKKKIISYEENNNINKDMKFIGI